MPNVNKRNKPRHMSGKPAKRTATIHQGPDNAIDDAIQKPVTASAPMIAAEPLSYQPTKVQARAVRLPKTSVMMQTNYDYVVKDLKRIGITAVCIFVAMGILAIILPMINL